MSLIEVLVALAIAAAVMSMALSFLTSPVSSQMKREATHQIALIKYLYQQASLKNQYMRLVFDLDNQKYVVQASQKPFYIEKADDEAEKIRRKNEDEDRKTGDDEAPSADSGDGFDETDNDNLEEHKVNDDIRIADVFVQHEKEKVTEGKATLYFFPRGLTEFAVIHISNADGDKFITLAVNPMTGTVEVLPDYVEAEELLEKLNPED